MLHDAVRDGDPVRFAAVLEAHMSDAVERILAPSAVPQGTSTSVPAPGIPA